MAKIVQIQGSLAILDNGKGVELEDILGTVGMGKNVKDIGNGMYEITNDVEACET